jgi:hypothetical protein
MQPLHNNNPVLRDSVIASPQLTGVHIRDSWALTETTRGSYNLTWLDQQVTRAKNLGKLTTLGIYAGADNDPRWNDLVSFTKLVSAFGAKFDSNPTVAAVHISAPQVTNESMEMHLPPSWHGTDAAAILIWKSSIDAYAIAFPTKPLILDVAWAGKNGAITRAVDDYARAKLGDRIMFIICSLKDSTSMTAPHMKELDRMRQLGSTIGFEMVGPSGTSRFGDFQTAINKGESMGSNFYQIYQGDIDEIHGAAFSRELFPNAATPEPSTLVYFTIGLIIILTQRFPRKDSRAN